MADMKENAKAQFEVDKANFAAAKAESKAQWEEAKASPIPTPTNAHCSVNTPSSSQRRSNA